MLRVILLFLSLLCFEAKSVDSYVDSLRMIKDLKSSSKKVFAIVPKNTHEFFFDEVARGCSDEAKLHHAECVYVGSRLESIRIQGAIIRSLIELNVDGIALSAIEKQKLAELVSKDIEVWENPVVAFDSPFSATLSRAYIGTDNYALGTTLANELVKMRPHGATYCIQISRLDSPNHMARMKGILDVFEAQTSHWQSVFGCPSEFHGDLERSLRQMSRILSDKAPDVYIITGGGPQFSGELYVKSIAPFSDKLASGGLVIASIDTIPEQLKFLERGLSTVNVGQNPYQIGVESFKALWKLKNDGHVEKVTFTKINNCTPTNYASCVSGN